MKRYVIAGNGVAGATAAEKIRALDKDGRITIFSSEPFAFYYRVRLPDIVAGEVNLDRITIHPDRWYEENRIDLRKGESIIDIDPEARVATGDKGGKIEYDELLLAVGARSFIPPVPGSDKKGVFALREYGDAQNIAKRAEEIESAILVGGGLLGLETAYGLTRRGIRVQVVEIMDRLLPRQMDRGGAAKLQKRLEGMGYSFYLGAKAKAITGGEFADGLDLEDGTHLEGGLILFSAGIRPNLELAKSLGLEIDKGVKVDDAMRTSREHVWAAGDLVEHRGRFYGIWPASRDQGAVAGANMAGGDAVYEGTVMSNTLKVVGVDLTAAGDIDPENKLESSTYQDENLYRKIVLDKGKIAGFIFYGATKGVRDCQKAMEAEVDVGSFKESMVDKDFDFSRLAPAV